MKYETIRTIQTPRFAVSLSATFEPCPDLDFDDSGETLEKVNSGEWGVYLFRVAVTHKETGLQLGTDYLGNSIYADPAEFSREHIGARGPLRFLLPRYGGARH